MITKAKTTKRVFVFNDIFSSLRVTFLLYIQSPFYLKNKKESFYYSTTTVISPLQVPRFVSTTTVTVYVPVVASIGTVMSMSTV